MAAASCATTAKNPPDSGKAQSTSPAAGLKTWRHFEACPSLRERQSLPRRGMLRVVRTRGRRRMRSVLRIGAQCDTDDLCIFYIICRNSHRDRRILRVFPSGNTVLSHAPPPPPGRGWRKGTRLVTFAPVSGKIFIFFPTVPVQLPPTGCSPAGSPRGSAPRSSVLRAPGGLSRRHAPAGRRQRRSRRR